MKKAFVVKFFPKVIPELALRVASPAEVSALLTVILPFEESVRAPFAVIEPPDAPKVMFPAEEVISMSLTSVSPLPP